MLFRSIVDEDIKEDNGVGNDVDTSKTDSYELFLHIKTVENTWYFIHSIDGEKADGKTEDDAKADYSYNIEVSHGLYDALMQYDMIKDSSISVLVYHISLNILVAIQHKDTTDTISFNADELLKTYKSTLSEPLVIDHIVMVNKLDDRVLCLGLKNMTLTGQDMENGGVLNKELIDMLQIDSLHEVVCQKAFEAITA